MSGAGRSSEQLAIRISSLPHQTTSHIQKCFSSQFQGAQSFYCSKNGNHLVIDYTRLSMVRLRVFSLSTLFMSFLKELGSEQTKSHWLHLLEFFHYVFSNVSSKRLPEKRNNHIGCICSAFLHCVFSNVSSNGLPERMHSHIGCFCLT